MQTIAPAVFTAVMIFQFLALALAGCILGAPTISEEKRAGTLGALLTTPLKAWQIVIGKLSAAFIQILILTLIATPCSWPSASSAASRARVVLAAMSLALSTAFLACILGLYHSIGAKRSPTAILGALVSLIASQSILPLSVWYLIWTGHVISWFTPAYACAPWALGMQIGSELGEPIPSDFVQLSWITSSGYNLLLAAVAMGASAWRLRRALAREAEGGSLIPEGKKAKKSKDAAEPAPAGATSLAATTGPDSEIAAIDSAGAPGLPKSRKKPRRIHHPGGIRDVGDQPVLWRELRQSTFRTPFQFAITGATMLGILVALHWGVGLDDEQLHYSVALVGILAVVCIAAVGTTSGISGERESRTWEALLTTPLTARQIVLGKFMGALRRQWFVPALVAVHFAAAAIYNSIMAKGFPLHSTPYIAAIVTAPIFALSGTGVLFSVLCRKSTVAAVCNFGLALLVWAVIPIMYVVFNQIMGHYSSEETFLDVVCLFNPVPMMAFAVRCGLDGRYELFDWSNIGVTAYTLGVAGYWVALTGIGLAAAYVAAVVLAARTGRRM